MKTKKYLSVLLAVTMLASMMTTFAVTSSAAIRAKFVGDTVVFRITGQLSNDEAEDNVKNITFATGTDSQTGGAYVDGEILSIEQAENIIKVTVKATKAGSLSVAYQIYTEGNWKSKQVYSTEIFPTHTVGETVTYTIPGRTLYPDNPDGNVKNITAENATVVSAVQNGTDIDVTLKATSVGIIYVAFDEKGEGALDFSPNERLLAKAVSASTFLDVEASTSDILEKKTLDQNYNLTATEGTRTDVTKVTLAWEIKDISATRTDNKIWDTENLCWTTASSSAEISQAGTAKFTLLNYSSVKMDAKVSFETAEYAAGKKFTAPTLVFDDVTGSDGTITLDTASGNSSYSKTNVPTGEITVTVTPAADDFKALDATSSAAKYGTYTVTIQKQPRKLKVIFSSVNTPAYGITINGKAVTRTEDGVYSVNAADVVCVTWDDGDRATVDVRKTLTDFENTSLISRDSTTTSTSHTYTVPADAYSYVLDFCPPMT